MIDPDLAAIIYTQIKEMQIVIWIQGRKIWVWGKIEFSTGWV